LLVEAVRTVALVRRRQLQLVAAGVVGHANGVLDQGFADPATPPLRVDHHVLDERPRGAVVREVGDDQYVGSAHGELPAVLGDEHRAVGVAEDPAPGRGRPGHVALLIVQMAEQRADGRQVARRCGSDVDRHAPTVPGGTDAAYSVA